MSSTMPRVADALTRIADALEGLQRTAIVVDQPTPATDDETNQDTLILDRIAEVLAGEWTPDTIDAVAALVRESGREIDDDSNEDLTHD